MTLTTDSPANDVSSPSPASTPADRHDEPWFARLGRFSAVHRRWAIAIWLVVTIAAAPLAMTLTGALSGAGWEAQGSTALAVRDELRRDFPQLGAEAAIVVYQQDAPIAGDPAGLRGLVAGLDGAPGAASVVDPLAQPVEAGLISSDGRTAMIPVGLEAASDADLPESAGELIDHVSGLVLADGARAEVTGEWPVWSDFNQTNEEALHKAELVSGVPTIILLLVAFGSVIAAGIPLLLAVAGIAVGFAGLHLLGLTMPLSVWSMNFSMMIGLAVGIDYSLFIVSRYREEREDGHDAVDAVANTLSTAGKAVFISALAVVLSLAAVFVVPVMVFRSMALGMILAVVATAAAALTLLPAILVGMGDRVLVAKGQEDPDRAAEGRWVRWTGKALDHPGRTLAVGLGLLLLLATPAAGMRLGMPGAGVVDEGRSSRDGYELVTEAFGPGAAAPIFVTVPSAQAQRVVDLAAADPNVAMAQVATRPVDSGRTVVQVIGKTAVDSQETSQMVGRLRDTIGSEVSAAKVGGPAAQNHDLTEVFLSRFPLAVGLIMVVAFMLLLVVFRSITIALSSILLNLVSVGASFGFATLVFQHGHGAWLLGIEHQGFVDAWAPLFFFALLFGLSMDYQLFLLAAIRETYQETGDTNLAIRQGIARTGRPITNAALIMIVVFVAFGITGPIPPTELGITLAVAVLLDATVIRMMLVPSIMGLLGDKNWWLPNWLDRILPKINFSH